MKNLNINQSNHQQALILAAGLGSRLAPITNDLPKSLVSVNGKPILIKQIENLYENGITDITIVAGYKSDILINEVRKLYPNISIIENKDYATTNNMYSAYLGINHILKNNDISTFIMMNADVFFDSSIISALLECSEDNAIVVDIGRYIEESMKVTAEQGKITNISKAISESSALGCSIDVYKLSSTAVKEFLNQCLSYIKGKQELNLWSEVALNDTLKIIKFGICPLPLNSKWFEIDNHEDLAAAEALFV